MRLIALAESGRATEAITEYRDKWLSAAEPFPFPESLLPIFQRFGETQLQAHLLSHPPTERTDIPDWVSLLSDTETSAKPPVQLVEEWTNAIERNPRDLNTLVGLTEAVVATPNACRANTVEWIRDFWHRLAAHPEAQEQDLMIQAAVYQMLLTESEADRVEFFEKEMIKLPSEDPMVQHASVAYFRCLRRLKQWSTIRTFLESPHGQVLYKTGFFTEFEFIRLMSEVNSQDQTGSDRWCEKWEQLLRLPLDTRQIEDLLRLQDELTQKEINVISLEQKTSDLVHRSSDARSEREEHALRPCL